MKKREKGQLLLLGEEEGLMDEVLNEDKKMEEDMNEKKKGFEDFVVTEDDFKIDEFELTEKGKKYSHFVIHTDSEGKIRDMTEDEDFFGAIIHLLHERGFECGTKEYEEEAKKLRKEVQTLTRDEMFDFVNEGIIRWPIDFGYVQGNL